jgi:hypothetical protein
MTNLAWPYDRAAHSRRVGSAAPRVSVLIPCYNLGMYLDEAVSSVLDQSFQDFEILIVDDGSTDTDTKRLLGDYTRPKTTVFRTANQGLAAARNFLVSRARGEYLCALDADDLLHPRYLERTAATLDADPSLGFASTRMRMFGQETTVWPDELRCDLPTLLCHDPVHCAALVRRSLVLEVGGYDTTMGHQGNEDWDLWIAITERGHPGVILDEALFLYRRREGSMSRACARGDQHLQAVAFLARKHAASYLRYADHVVRWKEAAVATTLARVASVERRVEFTRQALASQRAELKALRHRQGVRATLRTADTATARGPAQPAEAKSHETSPPVDAVDFAGRVLSLEAAYRAAVAENDALRASLSWRLTSPLRTAYDLAAGRRSSRR